MFFNLLVAARGALSESVPNFALALVLDLSDVEYLDSGGIHLIYELREKLRARGQTLQLVIPADSPASDLANGLRRNFPCRQKARRVKIVAPDLGSYIAKRRGDTAWARIFIYRVPRRGAMARGLRKCGGNLSRCRSRVTQ